MKVPTERLREMLAACEGVTPGPWVIHPDRPFTPYDSNAWPLLTDSDNAGLVAAHIANCDPDTIRSALSELLELRERLLAYETAKLPCDVQLLPNVTIVAGCMLTTLVAGLEARGMTKITPREPDAARSLQSHTGEA